MNRQTIGLAGEYAAASELCKRGVYAQLTLGNHKKTDILVDGSQGLARVSVKAKTGYVWPKVAGIWAEGDLFVFVDFKGKDDGERPNFYVLGVEEWKSVVRSLRRKKGKGAKIDKETNTIYWDPWEDNGKGWRGCSVAVSDIEAYKDSWPILQRV